MTRKGLIRIVAMAAVALLISAACVRASTATPTPTSKATDYDYASLIDDLRAAGATVGDTGEVSSYEFSVKGQTITVNGEAVNVYEFAEAATADTEAGYVSPGGIEVSVPLGGGEFRASMVDWFAPPHFYKKGRLIVIYIGDSTAVINPLEGVLGPQFAGR